jgi:HAD superfamily hydrolase (TIGR01484 family)
MNLFSSHLAQDWIPNIKMIASDMDGTLTHRGKFSPLLLERLEQLRNRGIPVLIVTGRSAGWVSALVEYLPVAGAIAENGGYLFTPDQPQGIPLIEMGDPDLFRQQQSQVFEELKHQAPHIQPSADNPFRITDWTFDKVKLTTEVLGKMRNRCEDRGWSFTYSSIQCHIKLSSQSKQIGLLRALASYFPGHLKPNQLLTIGDSPNDAELLDATIFNYSVGVANIKPYLDTMPTQPHWISTHPELDGFLEVTQGFLNLE